MEKNGSFSRNAIVVLRRRYLAKDGEGNIIETPEAMIRRVARTVAAVEKNYGTKENQIKELENVFFQVMNNLDFMPNSPTLMNAGRELGQLSACFVVPVEDSMESIFDAIKSTALIHKTGGGTGFSFSSLRPQNSVVKTTGGVASGPISFMKVFDSATQAVKQGGTRRGANMGILRVDHPDILSFIECKAKDGEISNFNISVAITDEFIGKVLSGKNYNLIDPKSKKAVGSLDASKVFNRIAECAYNNGEPGIVFIDKINKDNPVLHLGEVESTNPCVAGDTLVSTEKGLIKMSQLVASYPKGGVKILVDESVLEIGTYDSSLATAVKRKCSLQMITKAFKTGVKKCYKVITESGYELVATADHGLLTEEGYKDVKDLKIGKDKVYIQPEKGFFNKDYKLSFSPKEKIKGGNGVEYKLNLPSQWSRELGEVLGYLVGDGWIINEGKNCRVGLTFSCDERELLFYFKKILNGYYGKEIKEVKRKNNVWHLSYHSKYFVRFFDELGLKAAKAQDKSVPESIFASPSEAVTGFLRGLFSADGTVVYCQKKQMRYARLSSKSLQLLKDVQILLLNLGIKSKIYDRGRKQRFGFECIDKQGRQKQYALDGVLYELNISRINLRIFLEKIGFRNSKHQGIVDRLKELNYYEDNFEEEIKSVEYVGERPVYDLTEPKTYSFITNGFISRDCGEQPLLPYESCNLGSVNLYKMLKKKDGCFEIDWEKLKRTVKTAVHFLDNVIDANKFPLPQIAENTRKTRKIGLGVMGWATLLGFLEIPYDSKEAVNLAKDIMSFIRKEAQDVSVDLAAKKGEFPAWEGSFWQKKGIRLRNATLTTIAPTGTISIISGPTSSGIEPNYFLSYFRNVLDGEKLLEADPAFERFAKKEGFYSEELMEKIASGESIQKMEEVPEKAKRIFKTAMDISPFWHIKMQAAFQEDTDNAVSKTINLASSAELNDVKEAYLLAYKLGCKGITVYRDGSRTGQVLTVDKKKEEKEKVNSAAVPYPKPRPEVILGTTTKVTTGCGNLYITLNQDESGNFFEVFTQMGKAGGCAASQLEAVGRLVSLALRGGIDIKVIVEQLKGIRCPSPSWDKGKKIFSCSDAISRVLEKRGVDQKDKLKSTDNANSFSEAKEIKAPEPEKFSSIETEKTKTVKVLGAASKANDSYNVVGVCPGCGYALRHQEGCLVCSACGYSKC